MSDIKIFFDPKKHRYYDNQGRDYMSITTFIRQGEPEFDAASIAAQVIRNSRSKYYGMSKEEVMRKWSASSPLGTELHLALEEFINEKKVTDNPNIKPLVEQFSKIKFKGKLLSETVVFDPEYLIAGTVDLLEEMDDIFYLYDFKTSVTRPNGRDLSDDKLHKFSLQLECYKRMVEKQFKKPCQTVCVLWFKNFANELGNSKLQLVKVNDVAHEIDEKLRYRKIMISGKE